MSLEQRWNQKGNVIILSETTDEPLTFAGKLAGVCWGADTNDHEKNLKRGIDCLKSGHMRVLEYPQIYMIIDGYSARCIRELYTHIIDVTRLQASTRYIDYKNFDYYMPGFIARNSEAADTYDATMEEIQMSLDYLTNECRISKEDAANLLPLGMKTKIVFRCGLRELINIMEQRLCARAYHEIRKLMYEIIGSLRIYSDEWKMLIDEYNIFVPKCKRLHYCPERYSCGREISKETLERYINEGRIRDDGAVSEVKE